MSTTWFIAKEYLKRLEVNFEERGKKTFSLQPCTPTETEKIEVFPGKHWITLTTRLIDLRSISKNEKLYFYEYQIINKIPTEKHDITVEKIITEKRIIICKII